MKETPFAQITEPTISLKAGMLACIESTPFMPNTALNQATSPTIIALHGWLDNAASFLPLIKKLPQFHWLAIDLPGHGKSFHRPEHSHYHFIDWVQDIVEMIDALNLTQPPIIIGHSLGGMLATVVAGLYPEKLSKLVLLDAAGLVIQDDECVVENMRKALDSRVSRTVKKPRAYSKLDSLIETRQRAGELDYKAAKLLMERATEVTPEGLYLKTDKRLKAGSPLRINGQGAIKIISNISVPTLIVLATEGYDSVRESYSKYQSYYANHQTKEVLGSHHAHLEQPDETAEHLGNFLL